MISDASDHSRVWMQEMGCDKRTVSKILYERDWTQDIRATSFCVDTSCLDNYQIYVSYLMVGSFKLLHWFIA